MAYFSSMTHQWLEVWNTRPGGVLVFAPPCSTWVFLSTASTGRTWSNPEGNGSKCCVLANIFCRRMIYMLLCTHYSLIWFVLHSQLLKVSVISICEPSLYFAVKRGIYIVVEQPLSSVTCLDIEWAWYILWHSYNPCNLTGILHVYRCFWSHPSVSSTSSRCPNKLMELTCWGDIRYCGTGHRCESSCDGLALGLDWCLFFGECSLSKPPPHRYMHHNIDWTINYFGY